MTATAKAIQTANLAASAAADKLAENLVAFDVTKITPLNDVCLLVSARNERQVSAIADGVEEKLLEADIKALRREGRAQARWVLLDFGDVVVHVMHEEERIYYSLERLYGDCPLISLDAVSA
jgi:ribosome-associated protein